MSAIKKMHHCFPKAVVQFDARHGGHCGTAVDGLCLAITNRSLIGHDMTFLLAVPHAQINLLAS